MAATLLSDFYCTLCGTKGIPVWRRKGAAREKGHLKKLFCLKCQKETNHVECKNDYTVEDFFYEFNNNNFDENGIRKMTYKQLRSVIENGKEENDTDVRDPRFGKIDQDKESR